MCVMSLPAVFDGVFRLRKVFGYKAGFSLYIKYPMSLNDPENLDPPYRTDLEFY